MIKSWVYELWKLFAAWALGFIDPLKPYGTRLFEALARLTIGVAFEAACVRRHPETHGLQIALAQRSAEESFAPNVWHFPGSFYRPWESPDDVLRRLIKKEFGWLQFFKAICVGTYRASEADKGRERGHTNSELWLILGAEFGDKVQWFDVDFLPEVFYSHRQTLIPGAEAAFKRWEEAAGNEYVVPKVDVLRY